MYFSDFTEYWRDIVAHKPELKQFYRLNHDELDDSLGEKVEYPILVLNEYDGKIHRSGNKARWFDTQKCSIMILDKIDVQDYDQEEAALNNLKKVALQIFARLFWQINEDLDNTVCPKILLGIDWDSLEYFPTPFIKEHIKGWYIEFKMTNDAKEFVYNPADWT